MLFMLLVSATSIFLYVMSHSAIASCSFTFYFIFCFYFFVLFQFLRLYAFFLYVYPRTVYDAVEEYRKQRNKKKTKQK